MNTESENVTNWQAGAPALLEELAVQAARASDDRTEATEYLRRIAEAVEALVEASK